MEDNKVKFGTVVWFRAGYGFLKPDGDNETDKFIHWSNIVCEGYKTLKKGQRVSFEVGTNIRGQEQAVAVTPLKEETQSLMK